MVNSEISELLQGSYDLHVHTAPDPFHDRPLTALEIARLAHEAQMGGFVLKSHQFPTVHTANIVTDIYPGLSVIGSIVLNIEVGGLNPYAVEAAAKLSAQIIWMPTYSAQFRIPEFQNHRFVDSTYVKKVIQSGGISILDEEGKLLPEVFDILDIVKFHDITLASGHLSPNEKIILFKEACERGISKLIATHPDDKASMEEQKLMVNAGAKIEFPFLSCMPTDRGLSPENLIEKIRAVGVNNCIVTTDFGQLPNPSPVEGMRMAIATLLHQGMTNDEVQALVRINPLSLIGDRNNR